MTQLAPVEIVDPHEREAARAAEEHDLLAPFDPGVPWESGGRRVAEETIRTHASAACESFVAIGRCLIYARGQLLPQGWSDWLGEQGITLRSAQQAMQVALRFQSAPQLAQLGRAKAIALLGLADDQLQSLSDHGVVESLKLDDIDRMSCRELTTELRRLKGALERGKDQSKERRAKIEDLEAENNLLRTGRDELFKRQPNAKLLHYWALAIDLLRDIDRMIGTAQSSHEATAIYATLYRQVVSIKDEHPDLISPERTAGLAHQMREGDWNVHDELLARTPDLEDLARSVEPTAASAN